jgi:hypothetical protein
MIRILLALVVPLALGGCFSYSDTSTPPQHTTIVVPQGSTVTCTNGAIPPC